MSRAVPTGSTTGPAGEGETEADRQAARGADQTALDIEQTLADVDQTASDADQGAADSDQSASERDEALARTASPPSPPAPARSQAWPRRRPPAILADLLGLSESSAAHWCALAGGDWNSYAAHAVQRYTTNA